MPNNQNPHIRQDVRAYHIRVKELLRAGWSAAQIQDDPQCQQLKEVITPTLNNLRLGIRNDANKINSRLHNKQNGRELFPSLIDLFDQGDLDRLDPEVVDFGVANVDPTLLSAPTQRRVTLNQVDKMSKHVTGWIRSLRRRGIVDYAAGLEMVMQGAFQLMRSSVEKRFTGTHGKP